MDQTTDHPNWERVDRLPKSLERVLPQTWIGRALHWRRIRPSDGERGFYVSALVADSVDRPIYVTTHTTRVWAIPSYSCPSYPEGVLAEIERDLGGLLDTLAVDQIESAAAWLRDRRIEVNAD